ncbi:sulfotransferase domain-containing protein [Candidatus Leptofilum sp.]|uniref:sulfotransferase domain-containing protein n=1 Tax=Candidatus Leptofilum sp. TaxID=3241576 RepID=UPI003B5961B7
MMQNLGKYMWFVERFGLSPRKIYQRLIPTSGPKLICISIPKSGTHLLERALCLHPQLYRKLLRTLHEQNIDSLNILDMHLSKMKSGEIIVSHLNFTPERLRVIEARKIQSLFVIRDPRDIVVSQAFYVPKNTQHYLHDVFKSRTSTKERIQLAIEGYPKGGLPSMGQRMQHYSGWLHSSDLIIRFEDLIGEVGGGDSKRQYYTLRSLYDLIQLPTNDEWISYVIKNLFSSSSPTFRKGQIGQWKYHFDDELKAIFKQTVGNELIHYGYEQDNSW